jgi:hypothetical protein
MEEKIIEAHRMMTWLCVEVYRKPTAPGTKNIFRRGINSVAVSLVYTRNIGTTILEQ